MGWLLGWAGGELTCKGEIGPWGIGNGGDGGIPDLRFGRAGPLGPCTTYGVFGVAVDSDRRRCPSALRCGTLALDGPATTSPSDQLPYGGGDFLGADLAEPLLPRFIDLVGFRTQDLQLVSQ